MTATHSDFEHYSHKLESDAESFVNDNIEELLKDIKEGNLCRDGSVYDWIDNDTGRLHEFIDQEITAREAIDILENCEYPEGDSGLWEGLDPLKAVSAMGFWTYKNELFAEIKNRFVGNLRGLLEELQPQKENLEKEIKEGEEKEIYEIHLNQLKDKFDELEDYINNIEFAIQDLIRY